MTSPIITLKSFMIHYERRSGYLYTQQVDGETLRCFLYKDQYWKVYLPDLVSPYTNFEMIRFVGRERNKGEITHVNDKMWNWVRDCCLYILMLDDPFSRNERMEYVRTPQDG